jgi:heme ABC exporter ATP-binding subunit CcmA
MQDKKFVLRVLKLTKAVSRRYLVKDISFELFPGDVLALLGRNGAGKTTVLSLISSRLSLTEGIVEIEEDGKKVSSARMRQMLGLLPHDLFLYEDLTAKENLAFYHAMNGGVGELPEKALDEVGLLHAKSTLVREFSRGMKQRLAIARLLVSGARIWLLDEPFTGLDSAGRKWLLDRLHRFAQDGGAIVFSSHDPNEVKILATKVMVLSRGRMVLHEPLSPTTIERSLAIIEEGAD